MPSEEAAPSSTDVPRKPDGARNGSGIVRDYIAVARGSDLVVIRVIGSGNMLTAPALAEFAEEQRKAGFKRFVFDLERCRGLDSTFMGVMVGMHAALRGESGRHALPTAVPAPPAAPVAAEHARQAVQPMTPAEAVATLKELLAQPVPASAEESKAPPAGPLAGAVTAVNVPPDIAALMSMLGVDKFVKLRGTYDLRQLETTILPEKNLAPTEQHRLILQAHDNLVEIDKRNEARFGAFLKSLSLALAQEQ